ncbi:winged helix-turn-helix domain-containing protein [Parablastomonas sp. CN1-191]|uniref:winged helix-turn-helix domain-containing protein n=1 Tax=Parablastomonas sp. CN1-191 TaxID=3400908 RepID=UPI003BF7866E
MPEFAWLAPAEVPPRADLRLCGWSLTEPDTALAPGAGAAILMPDSHLAGVGAAPLELAARRALVLDVADPARRTHLLRAGAGEVLGPGAGLPEVEVRAARMLRMAAALPRRRWAGSLMLDLMVRDGFANGHALGLHPREFALAWRLAEAGGEPVSVEVLLRDVWRLRFRPETNTLPVHASRLRAKMRAAGLGSLRLEAGEDGYRFILAPRCPAELDAHVRIGDKDAQHPAPQPALLGEELDHG